jgi:mono/diheme cytochrome c family protein
MQVNHLSGVLAFAAAAILLATACSGSHPTAQPPANNSGNTSQPQSNAVSLSKTIQPIFDQNCVICHQGVGQSVPGSLTLASGAAYSNLVNVKSIESTLNLVTPGHPEESYLIFKLNGTQAQVGGRGANMPFNQPQLSQSKVDLIVSWITEGAPNN